MNEIRPSGQDLANEVNGLTQELFRAVRDLQDEGRRLADAESAYRVKRMEETMRLREAGVPVTIIDTIAKGMSAGALKEYTMQEALYKATQERINSLKLKIRIVEAQIEREWGNG